MSKEWRGRPSKRALALVREQFAHGRKRGEEIIQAAACLANIVECSLIADRKFARIKRV